MSGKFDGRVQSVRIYAELFFSGGRIRRFLQIQRYRRKWKDDRRRFQKSKIDSAEKQQLALNEMRPPPHHSNGGKNEKDKTKEDRQWPIFERTEWPRDKNKRNEMCAMALHLSGQWRLFKDWAVSLEGCVLVF